jgi:hypothetical protein
MHLGITSLRGAMQAERIAQVAGEELGWNSEERKRQIERFIEDLDKEKRF